MEKHMERYMEIYRAQMDQVTLSPAADRAILNDIQKANAQKTASYKKRRKRPVKAAVIAALIAAAAFGTVIAGAAIHGMIVKSNKAQSQIEGAGARVEIAGSSYFDLLAGDAGEVYVITNNETVISPLTDRYIAAWKSGDRGDTWEEVLALPKELKEGSSLIAGDLRKGEDGIEALSLISEPDPKAEDGYVNRVYRIAADSCEEYDMREVYERLGDQNHLFNVKYVNSRTIALIGTKQCLLYDVGTQKVIKSLPYDLTMGCLRTQDQFLLYGKEIYSCLDAETLTEQEPETGLQEFVQTMYAKNGSDVFPPMQAQNDTVVCATGAGIYEFRNGETIQTEPASAILNAGRTFNGLMPVCKAGEGEYYAVTMEESGASLWLIDSSGAITLETGSDETGEP